MLVSEVMPVPVQCGTGDTELGAPTYGGGAGRGAAQEGARRPLGGGPRASHSRHQATLGLTGRAGDTGTSQWRCGPLSSAQMAPREGTRYRQQAVARAVSQSGRSDTQTQAERQDVRNVSAISRNDRAVRGWRASHYFSSFSIPTICNDPPSIPFL